jgi:polar amino acid transport system permease protein
MTPINWQDLVPLLVEGASVTVEVTLYSAVLAFMMSVLAGLGLLTKFTPLRLITRTYVEIFRGTSLLVQLFWLYFALPFAGVALPKMAAAVLAIGLNFGAYGAEVVRSSILAVPKGQWEAAKALNMTYWQQMWIVIFPQAFVRMLPPFGNMSIELLKSTSLVYFITLTDLTYQAMILRNNYLTLTPHILGLLLVMYLLMAGLIAAALRWSERRLTRGRY